MYALFVVVLFTFAGGRACVPRPILGALNDRLGLQRELKAHVTGEAAGGAGLQSVQRVAAPGERVLRGVFWYRTGDAC